jgi:hypothetical protein
MMIDKGMIKTMKEPTGAPPRSRHLASRLRSLIHSVPRPPYVELSYALSVCCPFGHGEPLPAVRLTNRWNVVAPPAFTPSVCRRVVPALSSTLWEESMNRRLLNFSVLMLLIVVLFGTISIAALPDITDKDKLVGFWFGVHQQEGIDGDIQAISHFKADGTYYVKFRVVHDGRIVVEQEESGRWDLKDNVKTMVTTHANGMHLGTSRYVTETYIIRKLTHSDLYYEDLQSSTKFKAIRVREDFKFP